jgi:acyl dehydratase
MQKVLSLAALGDLAGQEVAVSNWVLIDQERIDRFAAATGDRQWIHVDRERCLQELDIGGTIAHGFLILSLISALMQESIEVAGLRMGLNYGLNKTRFPAPVPTGSRIRARFTLSSFDPMSDSVQAAWQVTLEMDGASKPACVAEFLVRYYPANQ